MYCMQNGTGETRTVKINSPSSFWSNTRHLIEVLIVTGIVLLFFSSFYFSSHVSAHWIYYIILISSFAYCCFGIILGDSRYEKFFLLLMPVTTGCFWLVANSAHLDLSPIFYLNAAIFFFCYPIWRAIAGTILLHGVASSATLATKSGYTIFIWLPVFALVWALMFWMLRREGERFRSRAISMETRAKGLMKNLVQDRNPELLPDMDDDTKIASAVANIFRIDVILNRILEILFQVFHPNSCFFFFSEKDRGFLKVMGYKTRSRFFNDEAIMELDGRDLFTWVFQNRKLIRHDRLPRSMQYPGYYTTRERILSTVLIPVIKNEVLEGILGIDSRRSHSFGMEEEQLLTLFADLTGDIIEAFRNYQQKEHHANYMEAFYATVKKILETKMDLNHRLELLIEISELVKPCDNIIVAIPDESEHFIIRKVKGNNTDKLLDSMIHEESYILKSIANTSEVITNNAVQLTQDYQGFINPFEPNLRLNSVMIIPLPMEEQIMGLMILSSRKKDYFTPDDKYFFGSLAAQFGFALENAMNAQKIEQLAITDGLTGVNNHRFFQDALLREIKRAERHENIFSILMIDIDHFKNFNDTYGHQAGDEVLKGVSNLLMEEAREIDIVARYGGEEFVLILLRCDIKAALKTAERIRKMCSKKKFDIGDQHVSVTMSIGVAMFPEHAESPSSLINEADKALYKAKKLGRNQVVCAGND